MFELAINRARLPIADFSKRLDSRNFRSGSCVTSIVMSTGDAQLYER